MKVSELIRKLEDNGDVDVVIHVRGFLQKVTKVRAVNVVHVDGDDYVDVLIDDDGELMIEIY